MTNQRKNTLTGLLFISPWLIGFLFFMAYPIYSSLKMSFEKVFITPDGIKSQFIKLDNYQYALFKDPYFMDEVFNFTKSVIIMVPIVVIFSMIVALLINQPIKMKGMFRAIFFLPVVISSGAVITELFAQGAGTIPMVEQYGIVSMIKDSLGPGLADPIIEVIQKFILILWFSGVQILIFLAGLQKINRSIYEAAAIDGASPWETFWKITLPGLKPFILVNLIYTTVDLFTNSVNDVIKLIKENMFKIETGFGYATALSWIYQALILLILLVIVFFFQNKEDKRERKLGYRKPRTKRGTVS
ncbi:sugar ABC transporter permease [Fictibacillus enclensis]|uniref:carbohydrate ABC transporter permease n=1 Tax=Fictibacillus enclensis TaxID=1017270 RepID=UPI0025A01546|nr:sugar ABC transporter permease [Fictibacillus enclensis]MDM5337098.1 sugar ABC transporter permease [Fictibacillus enclensis]